MDNNGKPLRHNVTGAKLIVAKSKKMAHKNSSIRYGSLFDDYIFHRVRDENGKKNNDLSIT